MIGYAGQGVSAVADLTAAAAAAVEGAHGEMDAYLIAAPGVGTGWTPVPVLLHDGDGQFAAAYHAVGARSSWCDRTATSATAGTRRTWAP
jgi:hypothetical protein